LPNAVAPSFLIFIASLLCVAGTTRAQTKDPSPREIIGDLSRIVAPDGVQETFKVALGGIQQWVYVRGQNRRNPVILFVHGGPASPMSAAMWMFQRPIEEYFTVVHYDQRGAGRTYLEADPRAVEPTLDIDRYARDAIELAQHLQKRYAVAKVILMGHSWGTIVGLRAALRRSDLFHAYVGIGQVINSRENERLGFEYAVREATKAKNETALAELKSIAPYPGDEPLTRQRIVIARKWAQHYGGLSAYRTASRYYFNAPLISPEYDEKSVPSIDKGNLLTLGRVLREFLAVDFTGVTRLAIPVVMFMGRHDYTTASAPTETWLAKLQAPHKRGVWFENSAHLIPFEEPGKMLVSLLEHVRPLAVGGRSSNQ
jgi:pimeloyl-ACP methyl ester carboxylesterase